MASLAVSTSTIQTLVPFEFFALAGADRPHGARAGHAFDCVDVPAEAPVAEFINGVGVVTAGVNGHGADPEHAPVFGRVFAQENLIELRPDVELRRVTVQDGVLQSPGFLGLVSFHGAPADDLVFETVVDVSPNLPHNHACHTY